MMNEDTQKNLYDLEHQRIINSLNIWYIILATLTISFLFFDLPKSWDSKLILLMKSEAILGFLVSVIILKLIFDYKFREIEAKIKKLKEKEKIKEKLSSKFVLL